MPEKSLFLRQWLTIYGDSPVTVREVLERAGSEPLLASALVSLIPGLKVHPSPELLSRWLTCHENWPITLEGEIVTPPPYNPPELKAPQKRRGRPRVYPDRTLTSQERHQRYRARKQAKLLEAQRVAITLPLGSAYRFAREGKIRWRVLPALRLDTSCAA